MSRRRNGFSLRFLKNNPSDYLAHIPHFYPPPAGRKRITMSGERLTQKCPRQSLGRLQYLLGGLARLLYIGHLLVEDAGDALLFTERREGYA